jgi:hypothetical protein
VPQESHYSTITRWKKVKGFIAGRNDKEDLEAMIWLLKILKHPIL